MKLAGSIRSKTRIGVSPSPNPESADENFFVGFFPISIILHSRWFVGFFLTFPHNLIFRENTWARTSTMKVSFVRGNLKYPSDEAVTVDFCCMKLGKKES